MPEAAPEATSSTEEQQTEQTPTEPGTGETEVDWQAEAEKWKAQARKHEGRAKANATAAERLAELERSNMTDPEKFAEAQIRAVEAELQLLRYQVAADKGLPASAAAFLYGDDEEEMAKAADELLAFRGAAATAARDPNAMPDLRQGARPPTKQPEDGNAWMRRAARGR